MDDPELAAKSQNHSLSSADQSAGIGIVSHGPVVRKGFKGFIDTFKRNEITLVQPHRDQYNTQNVHREFVEADGQWTSEQRSGGVRDGGLAHELKGRHLQMIAIGGCIGTFCSV